MEENRGKSFAQITLYNTLIRRWTIWTGTMLKTVISRRRLSGFCIVSGSGKRRSPSGRSANIGSTRPRKSGNT